MGYPVARRALVRAIFAGLVLAGFSASVLAQTLPSPSVPTSPFPSVVERAERETQMEQRVRKLEQDNRQILEMYKSMANQNAELTRRLETAPKPAQASRAGPPNMPGDDESAGLSRRARRGSGAQGTDARTFPSEGEHRGSEKVPRRKAIVEFAEGLEFASEDGEFKLQFHDLTQVELRAFPTQNTGYTHTSFFIPRQRWYFTGNVSKNLEYYTVINRGYGSLDLLDAFLSYRYDRRLRLRVGRMKTPYLYEYYQIAEGDLVIPERSLYAGNLSGNRQMGAMFLGELFQERVGYALGVFNGGRRSFEDTNNAKDVYFFLNSRPFRKAVDDADARGAQGTGGRTRPNQALDANRSATGDEESSPFDYLNLGGSFNAGYEQQPASPNSFRTANDQSTASAANDLSPTFLQFNQNVSEYGERMAWGAHMAWFYKQLFVLAEYGGGYGSYIVGNSRFPTRLPFEGYVLQASYFLTGEEITRRVNVVKPLKDFRVRDGKITGTGAVEVYARYSYLDMGKNVFTAGLADPNLWSNQANTVDLGMNWYLNFYSKIYVDWQHATFGQPVSSRPGGWEKGSDLFWLRFQLFF